MIMSYELQSFTECEHLRNSRLANTLPPVCNKTAVETSLHVDNTLRAESPKFIYREPNRIV